MVIFRTAPPFFRGPPAGLAAVGRRDERLAKECRPYRRRLDGNALTASLMNVRGRLVPTRWLSGANRVPWAMWDPIMKRVPVWPGAPLSRSRGLRAPEFRPGLQGRAPNRGAPYGCRAASKRWSPIDLRTDSRRLVDGALARIDTAYIDPILGTATNAAVSCAHAIWVMTHTWRARPVR